MRYWIVVYLPQLPLEALRPRWCEPGPYALIDEDRVVAVSQEAAAAGVHVGMRRGGAATVAPDIVLLDRQQSKEDMARDAILLALLQFTPEVTQAREKSAILDVTASLRLFCGHSAICHRIKTVINRLGFSVEIGAAPAAMGAWILTMYRPERRKTKRRRVIKLTSLSRLLDRLPNDLLPSAVPYREWFDNLGCDTLGKLRALPRAGLQRRTDPGLLSELDRAYGELPELFEWVKPPESFHARVDLMERLEHNTSLISHANGLILQLVGWLTAMKLTVARFILGMEHERGRTAIPPTSIDVALAEPAWREDHLMLLVKERMERVTLPAPVIILELKATHFAEMAPVSETLFPEPGGTPSDYTRLMELLVARLGKENVLVHRRVAEHRPESANCWMPATDKQPKADELQESVPRPFWILDKPIPLNVHGGRPFYGSPLKLIEGPERVEGGWWDDDLKARDYYIAQASDATCYWLFLERSTVPEWFLHGLFG